MTQKEFEQDCYEKAQKYIQGGLVHAGTDLLNLTEVFISMGQEHLDRMLLSDSKIDYNDEIVAIEEVGVKDTVDISVTGDHLFYCNGILTKNSFGLAATLDFLISLTTNDELSEMGQIKFKTIKNRYTEDKKSFMVNVDFPRMTFSDVDDISTNYSVSPQTQDLMSNKPTFNSRVSKFDSIVVN